MINECYDCLYADEYLAWWWYPHYPPTCMLGNQMNVKGECKDFEQIGRLSR